ncbi:MAG: autotransporter-associated beta strand repeat-containing protein, partial [Pseudomonadota bacterium]
MRPQQFEIDGVPQQPSSTFDRSQPREFVITYDPRDPRGRLISYTLETGATLSQNIDLDNGSIITISARGRATAPATITDLELNGTSLNDQLAGAGDLLAFNEFVTLSLSNFDPAEGWTLRGFVDVDGGNGQAPRMQIEVSTNPIDVQLGAGSNALLVYGRPLTTDTVTLQGDVIVQSTLNLIEGSGTSGTGIVFLEPGGLVRGVGDVEGLLIEGTLAPGNGIGTLTAGDVLARAGSELQFEIDAAGGSDTLVVTNSVELEAGTTFDIVGFESLGSLAIQTTEILIDNQSDQPIQGTFTPEGGRLGSDGLFFSLLSLTGGDGNDLTAEAFRTELALQNGATNSEVVTFPDGFPGFTFLVNGQDSATFAGSFSESSTAVGVTKDGAGTLNLTGDQFYTGDTRILAGGLVNDASLLSSTVVVDGGVYAGSGSSAGLIVNGGGVVSPGNSIGTLTVTGNAAFNAGSIYEVNLSPDGRSDLLSIDGMATISGTDTTIRIVELPGAFPEIA